MTHVGQDSINSNNFDESSRLQLKSMLVTCKQWMSSNLYQKLCVKKRIKNLPDKNHLQVQEHLIPYKVV